jgi:phosphoglycerate dehydrogenase-like enzyme
MTLSVHYLHSPGEEFIELLKSQLLPDVKLTTGPDLPAKPDFHALIAGRPSPELLKASPNIKAVIVPWAGISVETRTLLADFPHISLHNLHHNATTTAELGFALLLSAAKFVPSMDRSLRRHDWTPRYEPSPAVILHNKTALILGYGAIGRELARMCKGMGMTVLATRRSPKSGSDEYADEIHEGEGLLELLPRANFLLIALPHTPQTEGLIGEKELALLPEPAVLVNIGRGKVVDEAALYGALKDGRLHAAGLDVWYNYPEDEASRTNAQPANYPFHELDNVVMSPHRGGATMETHPLRMEHLARLLNAAARSEPIPNMVDLKRGY